jgi:hypothetical protein
VWIPIIQLHITHRILYGIQTVLQILNILPGRLALEAILIVVTNHLGVLNLILDYFAIYKLGNWARLSLSS